MTNYRPLSSAKVGEKLSLGYRGGWGPFLPKEILTITAVGTNWIKAGDRKWKIRDGRLWGDATGNYQVDFFDKEDEAEWAETRERNALMARIPDGFSFRNLPLETLRAVVPILFPEEKRESQ